VIRGKTGTASLRLAGLESLGQTLELYGEALDGKSVRAKRLTGTRYLLRPADGRATKVRLRYAGDGAEAFVVSPQNGKEQRRLPVASLDADGSFTLTVDAPMCIEIQGKAYVDRVGPAVEITDVAVRENGQVEVVVAAEDRSGIESVELYCDGKPIRRQSAGSRVWVHRPGNGPHTFCAVATDASPQKNKRTSFKRTVTVDIGKTRP